MEFGDISAPIDSYGDSADACSADHVDIRSWYPLFRKHSIKTKIISLPDRFASYLVEDGIILPERVGKLALGRDMLSDDEETGSGHEDGQKPPEAFDELDMLIENAINEFGGKIMVKLNDKAPMDALWINCGTLMCNSLSNVYMMLKASEKVGSALRDTGNYLVIRKWANLFPSMEFRCFIKDFGIVGICQKDVSTFYSFLQGEVYRIHEIIANFYDLNIKDSLLKASVTMDVYVDKQDRVWVVGFSPFGDVSKTDALLFTWTELLARSADTLERNATEIFRVLITESSVMPRDSTVGASRGPSDFNFISGDIFSRKSRLLQGNCSDSSDSDDA